MDTSGVAARMDEIEPIDLSRHVRVQVVDQPLRGGFPLLLKLTGVPLFLSDVPLSTLVSVGSALGGLRNEPNGLRSHQHGRVGPTPPSSGP